jgi:type III restriction enzyme
MVITNFHAFLLRERIAAGRLTKEILTAGEASPFTETPDQMVRRACRELGNKKNIIVINDEAHHCYRRKPDGEQEKLTGDERREAQTREEEARVWISGLEAIKDKIGIRMIYDLSATPFFLRGSGYPEGTLFPWVVSDFSLIDAIESGIVKVPRVPVADDSMIGEQPTYRDLWLHIRDELPKKGRKTQELSGEPVLPVELEGALQSLYSNYEKYYRQWERNVEGRERGLTPPVFIVVCNNTNVSKLVFDYISGWEKALTPSPSPEGRGESKTVLVPGRLPLFSNVENGSWAARPNTILIDSQQLESGEAMSGEFKKIASREIEEFKDEYKARFPGRDAENLTDEDLLREVMNTVGKPGRLGEHVRCVVSVSMLTEGWDANTVTHILGVRAFGTQLLCEQVVGRGLRRMSYTTNHGGKFDPEYAEVYGVPFSFIPSAGSAVDPKPGPMPTRVRALEERIACEITFPRVVGYRYELPSEQLTATFTQESKQALSTSELPVKTEMASIIGEAEMHTLYGLKDRREQEIDFRLASLVLEKYFRDNDGNPKPWLFPQLVRIVRRWRLECLTCKDNTFPQMLLMTELAHDAADRIYRAIVASTPESKTLMPVLRPYDPVGSTRYVDFDTTRPVYKTDPEKCHISHVVADTGSWEQKMAQALEEMDEVVCYVKNHNLGFTIPYTLNGEEHGYIPDYIVRIRHPLEVIEQQNQKSVAYKPAMPVELLERVRELRRNATDAENLLWNLLRDRQLLGAKFRRQHPLGGYILDFYCHEARLAIELDGSGHLEEDRAAYDEARTKDLQALGVRVIRFWNNQVFQETRAVLDEIAKELRSPSPPLPLGKGGSPHLQSFEETLPLPLGEGRGEGGRGEGEIINLIIEVSGEARKDKAAKVSTSRNLWIPAINNHGGFGCWAFLEISDPWDAKNTIRSFLLGKTDQIIGPIFKR